jgi:hypothetical protein
MYSAYYYSLPIHSPMRAQWLWQRLGSGFARQGGLQSSILRSGKNQMRDSLAGITFHA